MFYAVVMPFSSRRVYYNSVQTTEWLAGLHTDRKRVKGERNEIKYDRIHTRDVYDAPVLGALDGFFSGQRLHMSSPGLARPR